MIWSAYKQAERFIGMKEVPGSDLNPAILAMLQLDQSWPKDDEVPWCSAFANYIAWLLRLPRSKSLRARSWLHVGVPVAVADARVGFDVVVLKRGGADQPGADVLDAPGHVGFFSGLVASGSLCAVAVLGGNQSDSVNVSMYESERVLGVRRLRQEI